MNLLNKTKLYAAGNMQYLNGEDWRLQLQEAMKQIGVVCLDPYNKPFVEEVKEDDEKRRTLSHFMAEGNLQAVHDWMKIVRRQDLKCCDIADFLVVRIVPNVMSWGTAEELCVSVRNRRPIFLIVEGGRNLCPLWVTAMIDPRCIYNSLEEVIQEIYDIDSGKEPVDKDKWHLLKKDYR